MKKIFPIILITFASSVHAQNSKEWTQQKKTQIKYLLEQIAALNIYSGYVKKGYDITRKGLTGIHNVKNRDFKLHEEYFNSLNKVNPKIKLYWKVADIISMKIKILSNFRKQLNGARQSGQLTSDEITYCNKVFKNISDECSEDVNELMIIVTEGGGSLKDDERVQRIDILHAEMKNKYVFEQHFLNEIKRLLMLRFIERNDVRTGRIFFNISP